MEHAICFNCGEPLFGMADADLCWDCAEEGPVQSNFSTIEQALGDLERSMALQRRAQFNRPW
jgi:hypothetical protein